MRKRHVSSKTVALVVRIIAFVESALGGYGQVVVALAAGVGTGTVASDIGRNLRAGPGTFAMPAKRADGKALAERNLPLVAASVDGKFEQSFLIISIK